MENWYLPITLLPSVGFFIVAVSSISNALSGEIARLIELNKSHNQPIIKMKIRQLRLVNIAMVLLYVSAVIFSLGGLIGGLEFNLMWHIPYMEEVMICLGILVVILAMTVLMVYAMRSVRIKEQQFKDM